MSSETHIEERLDKYLEKNLSLKATLREALPIAIISLYGGLYAGFLLSDLRDVIAIIPGILILIPAILAMRGNISMALGSRLGSAIHMGLISRIERNPELSNNITAAILLSLSLSIFLGILGYFLTLLMGYADVSPLSFIFIALFSGVLSGLVLSVLTVVIALAAFRFGMDPDNVISPLIGTLGEVVTMVFIWTAVRVVIIWHIIP